MERERERESQSYPIHFHKKDWQFLTICLSLVYHGIAPLNYMQATTSQFSMSKIKKAQLMYTADTKSPTKRKFIKSKRKGVEGGSKSHQSGHPMKKQSQLKAKLNNGISKPSEVWLFCPHQINS